jgi:hypothetical protein
MGEMKIEPLIMEKKPEGKIQLLRRRNRWKDNIKTDLKEIACNDVYVIPLRRGSHGGVFENHCQFVCDAG